MSNQQPKVGDKVWVEVGTANKNEMPATILALNQSCDEEGQEEKKGNEESPSNKTGFLVEFMDGGQYVVPASNCRYINGETEGRSRRRSTRTSSYFGKDAAMDIDGSSDVATKGIGKGKATRETTKAKFGGALGSKVISGSVRKVLDDESKDDVMEVDEESKSSKKRKSSSNSTKKQGNTGGKKTKEVKKEEPRKPDPEEVKASKKAKKAAPKKKSTKASKPMLTEESVAKSKPKKKVTKKKDSISKAKEDAIDALESGAIDGCGGLNQGSTFVIEYAKTGRSTCKRCDVRIQKNEIRVGHRPLFRGKPGYQIYKHLKCIVFSEEIQCAEDVAGYENLTEDDYCALAARVDESAKEVEMEKEELEPDELVQKQFQGEIRDTPRGMTANLLPFQKEGVSWMYNQETSCPEVRGGILADEMGMGKTLQTIVTILDNRPKLQRAIPGGKYPAGFDKKELDKEESLWNEGLKDWEHEMKMCDVHESILPRSKAGEPEGGARAGTLVVCPLIALTLWKNEIEKFCEQNALSVATYHGPDRQKLMSRSLLCKYDVVLTTYQVLEADFRRLVSPNKVRCPNCGAKFKVDKLRVHLKYFCGEGAQRTEAQARTVRNSERDNDTNNHGSNRDQNSRRGGSSKKKTKSKSTPHKKNAMKVKKFDDYDSESDLSIASDVEELKKRGKSPRGAAAKAREKLKVSDIQTLSDGDDAYSSNSDAGYSSEDEEDSAKDNPMLKRAIDRQAQALKKAKSKKKTSSSGKKNEKKKKFKDEPDYSSSEEEDSKKKGGKTSGGKNKKKKSFTKKKKVKGKKKFKDEPSDSSSSSSPDDESMNSDRDPLDDIDMDKLVAEAMAGASMSILHSVSWWRVVLDEAHMIKSRSSQTSAAAFALIALHRWALSGTPLQNRVGEFYSLIRFLRLDPMAHYMCKSKDCDCKQIHYRMFHGKCKDCGHSSIHHFSHFNKHILNPIQRDGYSGDGRRAMFTLKNEVLDKCLLRRTKETRAEDMNLPPRIVTIKGLRLHPVEEDFYNALYTQTTSQFNDYADTGTLLNNYAHIFDLLMRMRQSVAHPYLVLHSKKSSSNNSNVTNGRTECHLCDEAPSERVVSTCCTTAFCKSCVIEYMETAVGNDVSCPQCSNAFSIDLNNIHEDDQEVSSPRENGRVSTVGLPSLKELRHVASGSILRRIDLTKFATSTKIEALVKELISMRKNSPGSKAIVFSQFVNMLDLIRWRLHSDPFLSEIGLEARALHGGMDVKARDQTLKEFKEDPNVRVLMMSLKAGGVALNLTVANHIYLMDPWWNPAAELQAIDRTHRLGQYRPIRAVRFICENTVEERILQLQEKKRLVFDGTVGRDAGSLKMLTVDDMKSLFT